MVRLKRRTPVGSAAHNAALPPLTDADEIDLLLCPPVVRSPGFEMPTFVAEYRVRGHQVVMAQE